MQSIFDSVGKSYAMDRHFFSQRFLCFARILRLIAEKKVVKQKLSKCSASALVVLLNLWIKALLYWALYYIIV